MLPGWTPAAYTFLHTLVDGLFSAWWLRVWRVTTHASYTYTQHWRTRVRCSFGACLPSASSPTDCPAPTAHYARPLQPQPQLTGLLPGRCLPGLPPPALTLYSLATGRWAARVCLLPGILPLYYLHCSTPLPPAGVDVGLPPACATWTATGWTHVLPLCCLHACPTTYLHCTTHTCQHLRTAFNHNCLPTPPAGTMPAYALPHHLPRIPARLPVYEDSPHSPRGRRPPHTALPRPPAEEEDSVADSYGDRTRHCRRWRTAHL